MITLIIDTSHEKSIVAFAEGEKILLTLPLPAGLQSSRHLFPAINAGFQQLAITPEQLARVAVVVGPGSFTGIRVGVAAAKGIAAPRGLPLVGLCSLHGFVGEGRYAALIDARIGGAYALLPGEEPRLVSKEELSSFLEGIDQIVGPELSRFEFKEKIECYPDPAALLRAPLSVGEELDLLYLRETVDRVVTDVSVG